MIAKPTCTEGYFRNGPEGAYACSSKMLRTRAVAPDHVSGPLQRTFSFLSSSRPPGARSSRRWGQPGSIPRRTRRRSTTRRSSPLPAGPLPGPLPRPPSPWRRSALFVSRPPGCALRLRAFCPLRSIEVMSCVPECAYFSRHVSLPRFVLMN